jgi:hypothetical protein
MDFPTAMAKQTACRVNRLNLRVGELPDGRLSLISSKHPDAITT